MKRTPDSVLVYSSESGALCPQCGAPVDQCPCNPSAHPKDPPGTVRLSFSAKGRKGKAVTLLSGVPLAPAALAAFAKTLKKQCGSGGTVHQGVIELQGDHRSKLQPLLEAEGWKVKRV